VVLGIACGVLSVKWGSSRNPIPVTIGVGMALISAGYFLASWGSGYRVKRAVLLAVGIVMMLGGSAAVVFGVSEMPGHEGVVSEIAGPDGADTAGPDGVGIAIFGGVAFCVGLGLVRKAGRSRRVTPRLARMGYRLQVKDQDVQREIREGEKREEIDRQLRGR
jgi:hypothetical protein